MLTPDDIALVEHPQDERLEIPANMSAYGLMSGTVYPPGRSKLDPRDRGGKVLFYWTTFPVEVETWFIGKPPTIGHTYVAEAIIVLEVAHPERLQQHPLWDGEMRCLPRRRFRETCGQHTRNILNRIACVYSPEALVGGAAEQHGRTELARELNRVYGLEGFSVRQLRLNNVGQMAQGLQHSLLVRRIEAEAREGLKAIEEVYDNTVREVTNAAAEGDKQGEECATRLAGIASFADLKARAAQEEAKAKRPCGQQPDRARTEPILMGGKHQAGGTFAVLSAERSPEYYEILRPWFFVGRDENCHVALHSDQVSALHATVARIGSGLAVVDNNSTNGTYFNGERIRQRFLATGDVLRVGDHWIAFKLETGQEFRQIDHSCRRAIASSGRTVPRVDRGADLLDARRPMADLSAVAELVSSVGKVPTDSRPLLIGHDSISDLRLSGPGAGRFHAIVFWDVELDGQSQVCHAGIYVEDLHSGRGTILNGRPVRRARLAQGDILEVGGHRITVSFVGDVDARAKALLAASLGEEALVLEARGDSDAARRLLAEKERLAGSLGSPQCLSTTPQTHVLAVTCVEGPGGGQSLRLDPETTEVTIGREEADLVLPSDEVSRRHAGVTRETVGFAVVDLTSTNGTAVNGRELLAGQPHGIHPGDIIRLGRGQERCDLLVHHHL